MKKLLASLALVIVATFGLAAAAVSRMTAMGFSHLTNAGGIADASASTGLDIVTTS